MYIFTSMLGLLVQFNIWQALYTNQNTMEQISLHQMLTFCVLQDLLRCFNSSLAYRLSAKIRSGEIGSDFVRPINLKLYLIADNLGEAAYYICFQVIPVSIMTLLFGAFTPPASLLHGFTFVLTLILGITLQYLFSYLVGLLAFWFKTTSFVNWLMGAFITLFAGNIVPLWFYPNFLRRMAMCLPFRFFSFEPVSIYLGQTNPNEFLPTVCLQLFWIIVIYLLGRLLWSRAEKLVIVQGG